MADDVIEITIGDALVTRGTAVNNADCTRYYHVPSPFYVGITSTDTSWEARAEQEELAFYMTRDSLLKTHPGLFVAIVGGKPIESGPSRPELARAMFDTYGDNKPFYIGYVGEQPDTFQVTPFLLK